MAFDQQLRNQNERDKFTENSSGEVVVRVVMVI